MMALKMKIIKTSIPDVLIIEPKISRDNRGFFFESFNKALWQKVTGIKSDFVQDNHSRSVKNVLRGLHYQIRQPQGKLVRIIVGEVFDVAVDLRKSSSTFGQWTGVNISAENKLQLWIPEGFAHGFLVLSETAEFLYKATDYYAPQHERCITWNDLDIGINWPLQNKPLLSIKDDSALSFKDADLFL